MSFVIIVGLVVAVIALLIAYNEQSKTIKNYEQASKPKTRRKRNGTK